MYVRFGIAGVSTYLICNFENSQFELAGQNLFQK